MTPNSLSGQAPFAFAHRPDLSFLPEAAKAYEINLHGGFAVDAAPALDKSTTACPAAASCASRQT